MEERANGRQREVLKLEETGCWLIERIKRDGWRVPIREALSFYLWPSS